MGRWYSFPRNMTYRPETAHSELPTHPGASEFYGSRRDTSHACSGMTPGERFTAHGIQGEVLHEERDQHSGTVTTWGRLSEHGQSGTVMMEWVPGRHGRQMVLRRMRRTRD